MKFLNCARLAGALIFLAATASPALGAAAATPQAGRQRVEAFLQGLDGLQAQFKQTLTDRNGRSKIESDGCESGNDGDEGAPGRRPRSGDKADGASCGGCDIGLT